MVSNGVVAGKVPRPIEAVVCIPTFRRPAWLERTIASVLSQETDFGFALVVIDNDAAKAEGAACNAGYIPVPLYKMPYFQSHGFFAGRWPIKEMGLTTMDYTKVRCSEAEAILDTGINCPLNESMDETLIRETAAAVRKVAKHYMA